MLSSPVLELRNIKAVVLRRSIIITASATFARGMSTLVSATMVGFSAGTLLFGSGGEDPVGRVGLDSRRDVVTGFVLLQPLRVAAELLFDLVRPRLERDLRSRRAMRRFQNDPLGDRRDDVAGEIVVRALAEGDVGADRTGIIFLGDLLDPLDRMFLNRVAGFDLMVRDTNVHWRGSFLGFARA
jgi:hypothetical protein